MGTARHRQDTGARWGARLAGFSLVELLVVIAIITLLIGMLLPTLSKAREQARKLSTRNTQKALSDGLEFFRGENEDEFAGYPPSAAAEDETEEGAQSIFGAQWLARYLIGKDLKGYKPYRAVPPDQVHESPWAQQDWYDGVARDRAGPYVNPENLSVARPLDLPQLSADFESGPSVDERTLEQVVILDAFRFPILYYRADPHQARRADAFPARFARSSEYPGVYTFEDNALFTGALEGLEGEEYLYTPWDFTGTGLHPIRYFGDSPPVIDEISTHRLTFTYYILDKDLYAASADTGEPADSQRKAAPHRRDSFLLISPGQDGLYGTADDVNNF